MKYIYIFLCIFLMTSILIAEVINKKDLDILKEEDKALFLNKCFVNEKFSNTLNCINFLGIKIFLEAYKDVNMTNIMFEEITGKSINYLKYSANKGNTDSYINLGWIFSINKSSFYDLNQSAQYYNKANLKNINIKKNKIKIKKKVVNNFNYSYIQLSTVLIEQLNIYFSYSEEDKKYISSRDIKKANMIYNKIINKSNVNKKTLKKIKEKVKNDNKIVLDFLKDDLKVYNKKYKDDAGKVFEKLKSIYDKLD